ncbi:MAG: hypothetical protein GXX89_06755 [Clostridiales bacterium]|jgi:beta-lactamase regulating signal transducer with metallopeptidase domain|nr:hypothetical protein [Clostridiales bacterium]
MWYSAIPAVLNMSVTAGIIIVVVLVLRLLLKRAPKVFSYALWAIVLFRLLCPVSLPSDISLLSVFDTPVSETGSARYIPLNIVHTEYPAVTLPVPGLSEAINRALPQGEEQLAADPLEAPASLLTCIWLSGMAAMLSYGAVQYLRLRKRLAGALPLRDNISLADHIDAPFVMGLLRPRIYLPSSLPEAEHDYIVLHERQHIRRGDHITRILAFAALCVHWFNPLVWLAFVISGNDMEMSCDEAVMKKTDRDIRYDYSRSLLRFSAGRRIIAGTPLAFGEGDTKGRIKNVLNYRKPAFWVVIAAAALCIVAAVCLLTDPGAVVEPGKVVSVSCGGADMTEEAAAELIALINGHRRTGFPVGADDPGALSLAARIDCADGSFYVLHYQYYSGFSFNPAHPGDDDYRSILTFFDTEGKGRRAWKMEYDFDAAFKEWYDAATAAAGQSAPVLWLDLRGGDVDWDDVREIALPGFPGVSFRWTHDKVEAVTGEKTEVLYQGMPVWSVYFCDLNGDGKPELCSDASFGSGLIDERIIVFDYAGGAIYELSDRGVYDYSLSLQNGRLMVEKRAFIKSGGMDDEPVETGYLSLEGNYIHIVPAGSISADLDRDGKA